ncbi:MAG: hypothetical protein OZ921_16780 [Sorangiineae bacterium]|nr:hypothetical protein [Sorangiineae bacterium]
MLAAVVHALPVRSSDGELSLLRARAEALAELPEAELGGAVRAARDYGAALWDLAGDPAGAIDAWERAARLLGDAGAAQLARDLVAFAGSEDAIGRLEALAGRQQEPTRAAALLVEAATLSLQSGERARALALALRATELDASRPEALAAVERSAGPDDVDALERVYGRIAAAALGCYGERAVHYRAARQLERRGELGRALEHAIRAFEAFPTEGVTYVLAARLANRMGEPAELVRALERVASKCKTTEASAAWLRRAAALSGSGEEGQRQRVDVLLRALAAVPDVETVRTLGAAMSALVASGFEEREIVELRFARAQGTLLPRLEGPEGARIAIESARTALESFGSARLGVLALARAARCDGDLEEFATLAPYARALATAGEAPGLVSALVAQANDRFAGAGSALTELGAEIARVLGDLRSVATLLVVAALGRPGDSSLAERAAEAVEELGDPELAAKLVDVVPEAERVAKLFEVAARAESDGDLATAMSALERIRDSAELAPERRQPAVRRLTALYGRAGRRDALESMLAAELARADVVGADRLRVTRDLAALVAARGDLRRGLELVTELMRDHVDDEAVLGDVIELASQAGERRLQADALARLADLTREPTARAALLRKLAPLLETLGDTAPAFERWSQLSGLTPDDPAALEALERELERRGDHERLAALLARRASLATMVDDVRRLRLRRATVLEQRLGRPDEARAELQALLATTGDNLGVLRVLADLEERLGAMLAAAPLWLRASAVARERAEAAALARRSAEAYLAGGDVDSAGRVLEGLEAWAESPALAELAVEVRRRGNDPLALAAALEELALGSSESPEARAALLLEAAQASEAGGDDEAALSRAEQATELCPRLAAAQLAAARLRYLRGGVGDKERARVTVAELRGARGALAPADEELKAFLTAEALDVAVGGDASLRELRRAELDLGPRPLVALALAERLARGEHVELSLSLFEAALAGDLARMRSRGRVALEAASAARRTGEPELALTFLEVAASDADTRAEALGAAAAVRAERLGPDRRSSSHEGPAVAAARSTSRPPPSSGSRYAERGATPAESAAEPAPVRRTSRPPAELPELPAGVESLRPARSPRASIVIEAASATEASLLDALARGSIEAGKELIQQLENRAGRSHDLLGVCRRVALLVPGDVWVLEKLHEAALTDHNQVHARALEHVLALFDPARAATAPPRLPDQPGHLEQVTSMLFRDLMTPALEALAIVWEGAEHVFRRDPGTYGITGLERVPLGAPTALGHVYTGAARALGLMRAPLFQRRSSPGSIALSVALLSPPALIVSGEVRSETPELWFHVGSMLAATLPQHALLFGSPESQTRAVLRGLALAFGSPSPSRSGELGAAAHLAEVLWESVPARLQRRLRELCDEPESLDYDAALAAGRRAIRRAGLYVAGDLGVALRETCADDGIPLRTLEEPGGLAALSSSSLAVADLLRLATSSQYAEARFQPERSRG